MTPGDAVIGFVEPDLTRPSGGSTYNAHVIESWPTGAPSLQRHRLPWPCADEVVQGILTRQRVTIVDGLIGSERPGAIEAARAAGHEVVLLVHMPRPADTGLDDAERTRLAALEARAVRAASAVVVPSEWAARDLERRYGRTDLIVALPGIEPAPVAEPHDPPVLLQLGAISPLKNQLLTVRAAVACRDLAFRLRLVGPVLDEAYAERVADALAPLYDRVTLEPPVSGESREAVLAGADLMLSVAVRETYGLTVTEGLARGIPAVVGRGTGAEEALGAGGEPAGTAADTGDPAELADVLRTFLKSDDLRHRWRATALASRERLPTWQSTAQTLAETCASAQGVVGQDVVAEHEAP